MSQKSTKPAKESKNYQAMLEEVESIVTSLGSEKIDLDDMVKKVEHGYELIKTMRARLEDTRQKIETLRESFSPQDKNASDDEE